MERGEQNEEGNFKKVLPGLKFIRMTPTLILTLKWAGSEEKQWRRLEQKQWPWLLQGQIFTILILTGRQENIRNRIIKCWPNERVFWTEKM